LVKLMKQCIGAKILLKTNEIAKFFYLIDSNKNLECWGLLLSKLNYSTNL